MWTIGSRVERSNLRGVSPEAPTTQELLIAGLYKGTEDQLAVCPLNTAS